MRSALLDLLRCPRTGQRLALDTFEAVGDLVEHGLLTSEGGTYPVVAGIPVLTPVGERAVAEVRAGRFASALAEVFCASSWGARRWRAAETMSRSSALRGAVRVLGDRLRDREISAMTDRLAGDLDVADILAAAFLATGSRMSDAHDYFRYRLGTPRHLVALSVLEAMPDGVTVVADFGCGGGHLTWAITRRWPGAHVVAMDLDFRLLLAARLITDDVPDLVCADISQTPLATGSVHVSFSSDVLSYVPDKWPITREMERVLAPDGLLAVTSVKDAAAEHAFAGLPITLDGWLGMVAHLDHRLVTDDAILASYLDGKGLPADDALPGAARSRLVTLLASAGTLELVCGRGFTGWPHARGPLGVNPLYKTLGERDGARVFVRSLPPGMYARDNPELQEYLPREMVLDRDAVAAGRRNDPADALTGWLASTAVLAFPDAYAPERWPGSAAFDDKTAKPW